MIFTEVAQYCPAIAESIKDTMHGWVDDFLYKSPQSVGDLISYVEEEQENDCSAIDHEWDEIVKFVTLFGDDFDIMFPDKTPVSELESWLESSCCVLIYDIARDTMTAALDDMNKYTMLSVKRLSEGDMEESIVGKIVYRIVDPV